MRVKRGKKLVLTQFANNLAALPKELTSLQQNATLSATCLPSGGGGKTGNENRHKRELIQRPQYTSQVFL